MTATPAALKDLLPSLYDNIELVPHYVAPTQNVLAVPCVRASSSQKPSGCGGG
jgi:hypothetical protein